MSPDRPAAREGRESLAPLLLDTDPALGLPLRDVDDGLALAWLCAAGHAPVAVTTVFGNAPLALTHARALWLREVLGGRWTVHPGARRPGDAKTEAVEALVAHRGDVLAIGPLSNIAAALARGASWRRLVVLGGTLRRLPNLRPLHTTELNLALDPVAAAEVLALADLVVGMDVCREVWFTRDEVARLPPELARPCRSWLALAPLMTGRRAIHPWDVVAAVAWARPGALPVEQLEAELDPRPGRAGHLRPRPGVPALRWLAGPAQDLVISEWRAAFPG